MATNKSKSTGQLQAGFFLARFLLRAQNRAIVLTIAVVAVAVGAALYGWHQWGHIAVQSAEYQITAAEISITERPEWIKSNVKDEALLAWSGAKLSLLDRELLDKVGHAFAQHPWVAKVVSVQKKFPAHVTVELEYRRPVLAVKINSRGEEGLLFVDREGVLLPSADFSPAQAKDFLRIVAAGEAPTSVYGSQWASERIAGAARVAEALENRWQPLSSYWIVAVRGPGNLFSYELQDQEHKTRVIWGSAPGHEVAGEPAAAVKIATLDRFLRERGSADKIDDPKPVDLRLADSRAGGTVGARELTR